MIYKFGSIFLRSYNGNSFFLVYSILRKETKHMAEGEQNAY